MKHLFTAMLICSATTLLAQPKDYRREVFEMDSVSEEYGSIPIYTEEVKYYPSGKMKESVFLSPSFGGSKNEYIYANGKLVTQIYSFFDNSSGSWSLPGRLRYFKDQKGRDTLFLNEQQSSGSGNFFVISASRYRISEDSLGRVVKIGYEDFDGPSSSWQLHSETVLAYNATETDPAEMWFYSVQFGNRELQEYWYGLQWQNGFTYENLDNPTVSYKEIKQTQGFEKVYDSLSQAPLYTYAYRSLFDSTSQTYQMQSLKYDEFDAKNRYLKAYQIRWRNGQSDTTNKSNSVHIEDANGDLSISYVTQYAGLSGTRRLKHVYSKPLSSQLAQVKHLMVYPNPIRAYGELRLPEGNWQRVEVLALDGKSHSIPVKGNKSVEIPGLVSGTYFIRATEQNGQVHQAKITVN